MLNFENEDVTLIDTRDVFLNVLCPIAVKLSGSVIVESEGLFANATSPMEDKLAGREIDPMPPTKELTPIEEILVLAKSNE